MTSRDPVTYHVVLVLVGALAQNHGRQKEA